MLPPAIWPRPVPLVGDQTSAAERAGQIDGWQFAAADRRAVYTAIDGRRDIRRFRPDPVPPELLERLLAAGHAAPSVGQSQPWRFIVVSAADTRARAVLLADRARLRQAEQLESDAARHLLDLKLEGLREAPLGIVVCCDRRTPAQGVLGRATFHDADMWSCACAIQNIWLAARTEGLGVGWVTLFEPAELATLLGLPTGVETLGWLCLGWPDERPPEPGLQRAGWSSRQPLSDVVFQERWPSSAQPPVSRLQAPKGTAIVGVRDDADLLLTPPGSLGALDRALDRLLATANGEMYGGCLVLVGADHPVADLGVSTFPVSVTGDVLAAAVAGSAMGASAAQAAGLERIVVDAGVGTEPIAGAWSARPSGQRGDLVHGDAMTPDDVRRLLDLGRELGTAAACHGIVVVGEVGVANTTVAAALCAAQLGLQVADVVGLGADGDTATLTRKTYAIEAALRRARADHGAGLADPVVALTALGGPEITVIAGTILGAVEAGSCVVLDGLVTGVAALAAVTLEPATAASLIAGQRSRERAHPLVLAALGLEPLLDLRLRSGEGVGACLATGLLLSATEIRRSAARTGSAPDQPGAATPRSTSSASSS